LHANFLVYRRSGAGNGGNDDECSGVVAGCGEGGHVRGGGASEMEALIEHIKKHVLGAAGVGCGTS
jgi:hypothetical protein